MVLPKKTSKWVKVIGARDIVMIGILLILISLAWVIMVNASSLPPLIYPNPATLIITPGMPLWNPYTPGNLVGVVSTYMPLAAFNPLTGQFYPVLARNWSVQVLPNGSGILTVYLRRGIYWFNGSATIPFTAWDVYAEFYIGVKAFSWFYPFMLPQYADEDIRVLNNYTIQFLFQKWGSTRWIILLTTQINTPYIIWKPIVDKLKTMNATQAMSYSTNITEFAPPYWALSPYYVTSVNPTYINYALEPMYYDGVPLLATWLRIFPFASWLYYPPTATLWEIGGNTQALSAMLAYKASYG